MPIVPTPEMFETARAAIPELPAEREARYESEFSLSRGRRAPVRLRADLGPVLRARRGRDVKHPAANWVKELRTRIDVDPADSPVVPQSLAKLVDLAADRKVTAGARPHRARQDGRDRGRPGRRSPRPRA